MILFNWIQQRIICLIQGHDWYCTDKPIGFITSSTFGQPVSLEKKKYNYKCRRCGKKG